MRRELLMTEFWPDAEPGNARNNLKTALASIRRLFRECGVDPDRIVIADRYDVRWLCPVRVDIRTIEQCADEVPAERERVLAATGDLLPGDYHPWAVDMRARLAGRLEDIVRAEHADRPSIAIAERLLQVDPYCGEAFETLIDIALANGKRGEARIVFERYVGALAEIGALPSMALEARVAPARRAAVEDERLESAGNDAFDVAELLSLETRLDDDDLSALLDWTFDRVVAATNRLVVFDILAERIPVRFADAAIPERLLRGLAADRRRVMIARIAQRLVQHEEPQSKLRLAVHYTALGRTREACAASLEAGKSFLTFAAWTNALAAYNQNVERLESFATSVAAKTLLRESHFGRGEALYQLGTFSAAVRAFGSALDLTSEADDAEFRSGVFVKVGHALLRLNDNAGAWMAVRQAEGALGHCGALAELDVTELASRLLCSEQRYDEAVARAVGGYARAVAAGAHRQASILAQRAAEPLRRLLRFGECAHWTALQHAAAIFAGPEIEAQALYHMGAVAYVRNQLDHSDKWCREALRTLGTIRRRSGSATVPLGLLEWQCHQSLAHIALQRGRLGQALTECEWLVHSPWTFNTEHCRVLTFATLVDVWLASGTHEHRQAALRFQERLAPLTSTDRMYALDVLTRARLATIVDPQSRAIELLHTAFDATVESERAMPDQVHISYLKLADAARGFDDLLAARATEAAQRHHAAVERAAVGARRACSN